MKKLITLMVVMLLPLGVFAQSGNVAIVYAQEVMVLMPEVNEVSTKLQALNENYTKELNTMQEEYERKYQAFVSEQESLTENIRLRRMQELQDLEERAQNLMQVAQEDMQKQQQELLAPVQEKLRNAIRQVGEEKGYLYIIDPSAMLYIGNNVVDATEFVKQKLGI